MPKEKISATVDITVLADADADAKTLGLNRSELIERALRREALHPTARQFLRNAQFGRANSLRRLERPAEAVAAFQETIVTQRTPFDDFRDAIERDDTAGMARYPQPAQRGLRVAPVRVVVDPAFGAVDVDAEHPLLERHPAGQHGQLVGGQPGLHPAAARGERAMHAVVGQPAA